MIQVANDRIPTLALHLANFLCCTMMGREHPGLTIYASLSDLTRLLHLYSSHNYCLCSFHKWPPLRPMVQVQHCTHFAYSVELLFVDSIDVCDCVCAKPNEILLKWHLKMGEMKLEKTEKKLGNVRIFSLLSVIWIWWTGRWWLVVAIVVDWFTRCTIVGIAWWLWMKLGIAIRSSYTSRS